MNLFEISGGIPLYGEVQIQGSKNAALPILAASILIKGKTVLHNCPRIIDIDYMIQILKFLGCVVTWEDTHILKIDTAGLSHTEIPEQYANKMRSSITMLGALLGRRKEAVMPYPGGCVIGNRPIGMHLRALQRMGVSIDAREDMLYASADSLQGAEIEFERKSVGATENAILAAVLANGHTRIHMAAQEPEITELCSFLTKAGADISGAGTETIDIQGVTELKETEYQVMPDRIVAGTYLFAVAATHGAAELQHVPVMQLSEVLTVGKSMGLKLAEKGDTLLVDASAAIKPLSYIETREYPGFPTDLQSALLSVLTIAEGESTLKETIFNARFRTAAELNRMGAEISVKSDVGIAKITGVKALSGTDVYAKELRGGAALVVAGLAAKGVTRVHNLQYIRRGYESIERDIQSLGGNIRG